MKNMRLFIFIGILIIFLPITSSQVFDELIRVKLGNEVLFEKHFNLIEGKRVGLVTNQTGVNSHL